MGNLITDLMPVDSAKKEQCEEIAKEFIATFSKEYVLAYGVEFTKMKLKQIEEEVYGESETKKELMYRKDFKCTDPHKMGALTKQGAIIKNWKNRYFVVNPDFSVSYYETEEAYHNNVKPKGVIYLAGYDVSESADNATIEKLKALAKKLGVDEESLPLPEKFPAHTLALFHERRRDYFITAADEEEKKEWVEMFKTCCRKTKGFKNEDPVAQEAFKTAYRRACYESSWYRRLDPRGGTEEQVLSETLVEIINTRVLSSVYSDMTGNFMIKKKVEKQIMKMLDSMVLALVVPAYKGLVETTEKMKEPLETTFNEKKDEIVAVQKKIIVQITDKMTSIVDNVFPEISLDIKKLYEDLKELTGRSTAEMRNECVVRLLERIVKDTKESTDVAQVMKKHYRSFDRIVFGTCTWDHWYKVYNIEQEAIGIVSKYKETFDMGGGYSFVYDAHDIIALVADAAFFTFEQNLEERTKDTDILEDSSKAAEMMEKVKNDVIPKYDADSKATPHEVSFQLTTTHVVKYVTKKIDPLTKDILKEVANAIPEPLKELISIHERYERFVEECVKEWIRKAIGITKPQENGINEEKSTGLKKSENGETKEELSKHENEVKETKEPEKVDEDEGKPEETKEPEKVDENENEGNPEETKEPEKVDEDEGKPEETKEPEKVDENEGKSEETKVPEKVDENEGNPEETKEPEKVDENEGKSEEIKVEENGEVQEETTGEESGSTSEKEQCNDSGKQDKVADKENAGDTTAM